MKKVLLLFFGFAATLVHAQDPAFTQSHLTPLLINPALTGSWASGRADLGYRLQWPRLSGCYQTFNASYDQYFRAGGLGFNYMHDDAGRGTMKTDRAEIDYAPYIALHKDSTGKGRIILQPGISIGFQQKTLDFSSLSFGDMIDPRRGFVNSTTETVGAQTRNMIDFSAGLLVYGRSFEAGFAAFHLTEPDEGFIGPSRLPMRIVLHSAVKIAIGRLFVITPSAILMKQQDFRSLVLNMTIRMETFSLGIGYRNQDAVLFSAGYDFHHFLFRYSYDLTTSHQLKGTTGGAHELHLGYCFATKKWDSKRTNLRRFN